MCVMVLMLFVKQKTAYDMRISDWSSDVCSSDLAFDIGALAARGVARGLLAGFEPAACNEDETDQDRGGLHGRISKSWSRSALPGTIRMQSMSCFSGMPVEPVRS